MLEDLVAGLSPARREMLAELLRPAREPIAVVGMACRFPGADTPESFWRLLCESVDAVREVPPDRWDVDAHYAEGAVVRGKTNSRWAGIVEGIDTFDAGFFGISPREAARMDPQHRLLLEVTWNALEDAGFTEEALRGSATGVYVGLGHSEYSWMQSTDPSLVDVHSGTGISLNVAAGRISYLLDLAGPCLALDTGCSSALVAVHLAIRSLRDRETDQAIVGSANAVLLPLMAVMTTQMGGTAQDGRCKAFDATADGYVRGEGAGVVVLKRLSDAVADGDPVRAVLLGSAINQDGRTAGLTAPSQLAQQAVLTSALRDAGVDPSEIGYVEAHGTGTPLGDPIELQALQAVLDASGDGPCYVGSVKTNLGHLEAAAGIAGLIKAVLAIEHRVIPPNLHFRTWNPNVPTAATRLRVPTEPVGWSSARLAGVSAFGWSGTNSHVILGPAADVEPADSAQDVHILPVSARSARALRALTGRWADLLETPAGEQEVAGHTWTAARRRTHYPRRVAFVDRSAAGLAEQARAYRDEQAVAIGNRRPRVAFLFGGHGSQWAGMGHDLYQNEPVFRTAVDECGQALAEHTDWSLTGELFATGDSSRLAGSHRADIIQPAIFAVQVGLARLLEHWGVVPDMVLGHSLGEVAAAHIAGGLSLPDAVRVVAVRSRLAESVRHGLGLAVLDLPARQAEELIAACGKDLGVVAVNSPASATVGGPRAALDSLIAECERQDIGVRRIHVEGATHCPAVDPVLPQLRSELAVLRPVAASVPFLSTVDGMDESAFDAEYWVANLRRTVRFDRTADAAIARGATVFVEIGPHPLLLRPLRECAELAGASVTGIPALRRESAGGVVARRAVADLWERGHDVNWATLLPQRGRVTRAPAYPWQRQRYWTEAAPTTVAAEPAVTGPRACVTRWHAVQPDTIATSPARPHMVYEPADDVSLRDPDALTRMAALAAALIDVVRTALAERAPVAVVTRGGGVTASYLTGLARTLRIEHPELDLITIDVDAPIDVTEVLAAHSGETELAIRDGAVLARRLLPLPSVVAPSPVFSGTQLITGGLGGVGLALAGWLAAHGARSLVLASRNTTLSESASDAVAKLRARGVDVRISSLDVADLDAVRSLVASTDGLRGIFHAAGVLDDRPAMSLGADVFERVARAKICGTWNLHVVTQSLRIEHFVVFSSLAAVLGSPGQGAYAAANAGMDAIARLRRDTGLPGLSVSWGPWSDVGGAGAPWMRFLDRIGIRSTPAARLLALLGEAMAGTEPHITALDADVDALSWLDRRLFDDFGSPATTQRPVNSQWAKAVATEPGARAGQLAECLLAEIAAVLRVRATDIDPEADWASIGLDSVTALEVTAVIYQGTGVRLSPRTVVECPSISSLAEFLNQELT